jgi:hypothetical protein
MLTLLILIARLTAPAPEFTIEEMVSFQAHAEAALRLQAGEVKQSSMQIARPEWAFETPRTPVELDIELEAIGSRVNPFASDDGAGPFADVVTRCEPICRR